MNVLLRDIYHRDKVGARSVTCSYPSFLISVCFLVYLSAHSTVFAQSDMPVAHTVLVVDPAAPVGAVVHYNEAQDVYRIANASEDDVVFGVVADRPAMVFVTSFDAVPVVSHGVSWVRVRNSNGPIAKGDVLAVQREEGVAVRASLEDEVVFAVALEPFMGNTSAPDEPGIILADIGYERAQALQEYRREVFESSGTGTAAFLAAEVSATRVILAVTILIGALGFILFSFRSILSNSVVSIGRNPRARASVITMAVASVLLVIILGGGIVLIAIGVMVLPL